MKNKEDILSEYEFIQKTLMENEREKSFFERIELIRQESLLPNLL